jgi:HD superfamily phosphohydrolase
VLHELVSGTVDVDRMDYLLRDSLYTGVKYGLFDLERILNCLIPLSGPDGRPVLAIQRKGVEAVEEFLFSRYFMYWQVYYHGAVRAAELVLRLSLERARELWWADQRPPLPGHLEFLFEASTESGQLTLDFGHEEDSQQRQFLRAFLELDDTVIFYAIKLWSQSSDPILADLAGRVRQRRFFKVAPHPGDPGKVEEIRDIVKRRFGEAHRFYLGEDLPHHHMATPIPLRVETGPGTWSALAEVSRLKATPFLEHGSAGGYLLYPEECRAEIEKILL